MYQSDQSDIDNSHMERGLCAFLEYIDDSIVTKIQRITFHALNAELLKLIPRPKTTAGVPDPEELITYIHQCRNTLEQLLLDQFSAYPATRWLYYVRALPDSVFIRSDNVGSGVYRAQLAEALTGKIATYSNLDPLNYPLHESVLRRAVRFSQAIVYLSNFHTVLHLAGKGIPFKFTGMALPVDQMSREQRHSLRLFDNRVQFDQYPLGRLGTQALKAPSTEDIDNVFAFVGKTVPGWIFDPPDQRSKLLARYTIRFFDLGNLAQLVADQRIPSPIWSDEAGALLILLRIAAVMMVASEFRRPIWTTGFVAMKRSDLMHILKHRFDDAKEMARIAIPGLNVPGNADVLLEELQSMRPSNWPVVLGPVVRCSGDLVYLDLTAASSRFSRAFEFPRATGAQANARAEHFESSVQALLDSSSWANRELRTLRRRVLRYQGRRITDIDAIGAKGGRLLIVSCKSILYAEYDIGDYRILRNASDAVQRAVEEWTKACGFLRANPVGDNYDFRAYREIIAVVCTPVVVYLPLGPATQMSKDGLYPAVSVSELRAWLDGGRLEALENLSSVSDILSGTTPLQRSFK